MSKPDVTVGLEIEAGTWGDEAALEAMAHRAIDAAFAQLDVTTGTSELSILFTDDAAIQVLNREWRAKNKPTNVLSFPAFPVEPGDPLPPMLGDIVLAFETVAREAVEEDKPFADHLTHLTVHGLLHLLGYDHESEEEAEEMEALERQILGSLAIPDPYR